ncbi:hypothetical protein C7H19_23695 [Aphanothece hegewaldii CCALA 016]|uniref:Uncharacterized protein n=1 Tax=Aphanothece hegewaldii CCALA 016 TaxID=2107694 RepID=A0A2T1LR40_9CHRO|nr:hypothetical protein [Aphanothece hegewaldii]PSF30588.1 hypothetical protein C7H19_23695 [Aphanothece hegewaldii CCALA 016]
MRRKPLDPAKVTITIILFALIGAVLCVMTGKGDSQNFLILASAASGGYYGYLQGGQQKEIKGDGNERHF